MNAELQNKDTTSNYRFVIKRDNVTYEVTVWTNDKGKFIDDEMSVLGDSDALVSKAVSDEILEYLSSNWTEVTGE